MPLRSLASTSSLLGKCSSSHALGHYRGARCIVDIKSGLCLLKCFLHYVCTASHDYDLASCTIDYLRDLLDLSDEGISIVSIFRSRGLNVSSSAACAKTLLFLASMAGTINVSFLGVIVAFSHDLASASVEDTAMHFLPAARAIPLTAATPILIPVKEPGADRYRITVKILVLYAGLCHNAVDQRHKGL